MNKVNELVDTQYHLHNHHSNANGIKKIECQLKVCGCGTVN